MKLFTRKQKVSKAKNEFDTPNFLSLEDLGQIRGGTTSETKATDDFGTVKE